MARIATVVFGRRLPNSRAKEERLPNSVALAILSSDALSSVAYATEEILRVLVLGGALALTWSVPLGVAIVGLLAIVTMSYRQLIRAYPSGGGAYTVAKENLGTVAGLVAASGLLIDYVLTVAVSVSAGIAALASAFPSLNPMRIELALGFVAFLTLVNLRGVRESGRAFSIPTMLFILSMAVLITVGLAKWAMGTAPAGEPTASAVPPAIAALTPFLLLRAFSSGCAALTGVEAISNSVGVFKAPEPQNAVKTLTWMALILGAVFMGITLLARHLGATPSGSETVVSQIARLVLGKGPLYYVVQFSTLAILLVAANTSFAGFPRVTAMLGRDGYLPHQFSNIGGRLVYANGIVVLAGLSALLIFVFQGSVDRLIPIYAVGVFLSFTLAQAGLVRRWLHTHKRGWKRSTLINGFGAAVTGATVAILALTKFTHGAWLVTLLVPIFLYGFYRIHRHYEEVARELALDHFRPVPMPKKHLVIVPVAALHKGTLEALSYARGIAGDVRAVHVAADGASDEALQQEWQRYAPDIPLDIVRTQYRLVVGVLMRYLSRMQRKEKGIVTVVIPEIVPRHWWEWALHSQTATVLKLALLFRRHIAVVSVAHRLRK